MTNVFKTLSLFFVTAIMAACNNEDKTKQGNTQDKLFCDYKIIGEEGHEFVNCLFLFKQGGSEGRPVLLKDPAKLTLDGEAIYPDSAGLSGVIYDTTKSLTGFGGKHNIVFTDVKGQTHAESFEFMPFSLTEEIPAKVKKASFAIRLKDLGKTKVPVRLVLADTAFATNDINEIIDVDNGNLLITDSMLQKLKAGPIFFEIVKEEEKSLQNNRGRILTSYGLKREFELVE
ncbi:MAG: hypothetical protein ACTHMD_15490 [Flavisolibacter sp.]